MHWMGGWEQKQGRLPAQRFASEGEWRAQSRLEQGRRPAGVTASAARRS
jgi:hypothetical protein